VIDRPFIIDT